jgi:hypothetical protein
LNDFETTYVAYVEAWSVGSSQFLAQNTFKSVVTANNAVSATRQPPVVIVPSRPAQYATYGENVTYQFVVKNNFNYPLQFSYFAVYNDSDDSYSLDVNLYPEEYDAPELIDLFPG